MIKKRFYLLLSTVLLLVFTVGCQITETKREEPFIFTYTFSSLKNEDSVVLNEWLSNAKAEKDSNIHSFEMDNGYHYYYARGYSDVLVTYQREQKKDKQYSLIKVNFKKGNETDEVFIQLKYNTLLCCDAIVIDDTYGGD